MTNPPGPSSSSASSNRFLWILIAVISGVVLAFRIAGNLRDGGTSWGGWGGVLSPLGILMMAAGSLIDPRRGSTYRVFMGIAFALIVTGLVLVLLK